MKQGLRRKACALGMSLTLLLAMAGCGGGGGGSTVTPASNNPVPAISSLSPISAVAGAAAQTLTVNGANFLTSSTVTYNHVGHTATFVNSGQVMISLSVSDQAMAGSYPVVVTNPTPGGGSSAAMNFTTNNPIPAIGSLSPTSAMAGTAAQTLTVNGANFLSSSTVTYNNVAHTATFVSAAKLTIQLTPNDESTANTYPVVVTNPAPGGGASNAENFTVKPAGPNVSVSITSPSNPASVTVGLPLAITATVENATANLTWSVDGVSNGSTTLGQITGSNTSVTYTAPTSIPGNDNPVTIVATQGETGETASLTVTINPSTAARTAVTITGGNATGINLSLSSMTTTLGLADVGTCNFPTLNECSASVTGIQVSASGATTATCPSATCTIWLLGQGLTNAGGTAVTSGLTVSVTHGSTSDVTVSDVTPLSPVDGFTNVTFQTVASGSAATGNRNLVVTLGDGETQVYPGAIQIVP